MTKFNPTYSTFQSFRAHFNYMEKLAYFKIILRYESSGYLGLHYIYRALVWLMVFTYNLQHMIRLVQVRHSTVQMINILFILLTCLTTLGKQLSFNLRSKRIDEIVNTLKGTYFAPRNQYQESVLKRNGYIMQNLLRAYLGSVLVCGTLWAIFPIANKMLGKKVEFIAYFPFDTSESPRFELSAIYLSFFLTFQGCAHATMDCIIVSLLSQARVQLQILRYNLEHLTDIFGEAKKIEDKLEWPSVRFRLYDCKKDKELLNVFQNRLVRCVLHYKKIKWFVEEIESIFTEVLSFQLFVTALVICTTVYKLVNLDLSLAEVMSNGVYLVIMLQQFFFYCYFGTQLQYESEFVNQSVFFSGWPQLPPAFRRQLLIVMQSYSRPIVPRIASIVPITLQTYITVLRASYTLFTFLSRK